MAKKKTTRKALLKSPDEFLTFSERALHFFRSRQRYFQYAAAAIAVVVIGYLAVNTYLRYINNKGQTAYNEAYYALVADGGKKTGSERLKESGALFEKVIDEYGSSKAARLALPQVAFSKFVQKDFDEAISLYKKFLDSSSGDRSYQSLARLALATCYEAKGEVKTAIKTVKPLLASPGNPFKEGAMLNLARLYRLDNQPEKEKEILKRFVLEHGDSPFVPIAKARL
jgi:predicted negative regulator of RcsB-dependent stress response